MKDLGVEKQILGIEVHKDVENSNLWLSQRESMVKIPMRFNMNIVKPINIPLAFHWNISSRFCLGSKEENDYMSHVPYANAIGRLMFAIKFSRLNISHAVRVVSGHMEKLSKEHWKWVLQYLRGMHITYNGCSDLVYAYVDLEEVE
jgi:hypothetical protein